VFATRSGKYQEQRTDGHRERKKRGKINLPNTAFPYLQKQKAMSNMWYVRKMETEKKEDVPGTKTDV